MIHGFLNIDKPAGITSHDVVARLRRVARQKRIGHAGTLDPAATGVLVVALGQATRLIEYVQEETSKRYLATIQLGTQTTTDDGEGQIVAVTPVPELERPAIELALGQFRGEIAQVPPMYSALHHQGRRLHELAREGIVVERAARPVTIEQLTLVAWATPLLTLDIMCSKGTYIRSLARDIGVVLGCGAHLQALRRTQVGQFGIESATPLASIEENNIDIMSIIISADQAVADWPAVRLSAEATTRVQNGMPVALEYLAGARARAYAPDGTLLALLARVGETWKPEKVFHWAQQ